MPSGEFYDSDIVTIYTENADTELRKECLPSYSSRHSFRESNK